VEGVNEEKNRNTFNGELGKGDDKPMQALTTSSANAAESSDAPWQERATVLDLFVS
jgi:hypothetical protein